MIESWEIKKFINCLQKVRKTTKIPKKQFLNTGLYPVVSQEASFINGYWDNKEDLLEIEKPVVIFGDHTKVIKYVDFSFVRGADGVKVLLPIEEIDSKFFSYQLQSIKLRDLGYARHYRLLKEELISIPPLGEQKEIVSILDDAFASIDKAKANIERNIENAKELCQSKLNEVFSQTGEGWEEKMIDDMCTVKGRIGYRGYTKTDLVEKGEGAITLSPSNIKNNQFNTQKCTYISWFKYDQSPEIKIYDGDVIFVKTGSTYGKVAIVENLTEKATINPQFVVLKDIKCLNKFFYYSLLTKSFKDKIESIVGGSAMPTLSQANLKKQTILVPSEKQQKTSIDTLNKLDNLTKSSISNYEKELENLEELKKSILQKAFNGELTNKSVAA